MSFVNLSDVQCCSMKTNVSAKETCFRIQNEFSCRMLVQYIDYLQICFCYLGISNTRVLGLIAIVMLLIIFALLHVLTKFFFIPNFITIIQYAPMTIFGNCYLLFGLFFIMPYYLGDWPICNYQTGILCALQVSKLCGDTLKFFVVGVLVICVQGHRVDGVTLWSSMVFLMIMMGYLRKMIAVRYKMVAYAVFDTPYQHLYLFRSMVFGFTFILVLIMVFVVSHESYKRRMSRLSLDVETFSDIDSDDEILGDYQKMRIFSAKFLWWNSVDGMKNLQDYYTPLKIIMIPLYVPLAHFIPVLTDRRFLHGWSKYVVCLSLILFPFVCLPICFNGTIWLMILTISWFCSALVFISTHTLRRPNFIWMFALIGILISSVFMSLLSREGENIIWQYIRIRFKMRPDHIPLMYFGICEAFCLAIVVNDLQHRKLSDASFGVVASLLTYTTCSIFPFLYFQDCYTPQNEL
ncbi:mitochondrial sodium/calcium exchanger protein isoform X2 [Drosophila ananassae]|uniref:mitochondrial sodium/calcium exchanger protein isoform X2 n=1 Tax=Drosophila ananassae TaxID=7217 RepID=UPI0013A5CD93|nr:mitochondrial sodium/calcium exchanger protein isoform X2 [Drosophila ananassae]